VNKTDKALCGLVQKEHTMRVLLTGGGTGGHVTPALSVAKILLSRSESTEILFIGRKGGGENSAVKKMNLRLEELEIYGIKRSISPSNLKRAFCALRAVNKAKKIINEFSPDVILGTGGYVCWPVLVAGRKLGVPTAIHESNASPGLVTRLLSKHCDAVLLNTPQTKEKLKNAKRIITVGNPISPEIYRTSRATARGALGLSCRDIFILSFGGSGGAAALNSAVLELMSKVSSKVPNVRHLHATGKAYYESLCTAAEKYPSCKIIPYIENMPIYLRAADIVISRCGAMTISELAAAECCSVLIPSPNVTGDHQRKNAEALSLCGAAIMLEEKNLMNGSLCQTVEKLIFSPSLRMLLSAKISLCKTPDAAEKIADVLAELSST